jgi:hypothetical protein
MTLEGTPGPWSRRRPGTQPGHQPARNTKPTNNQPRQVRSTITGQDLKDRGSATIAINGTQQTFPPAVPDDKQAVLEAIRRQPN